MNIAIVCVTRSGCVSVQTLITLLKCHPKIPVEFVDENQRTDELRKLMKQYDRIVWIEYGVVFKEGMDMLLNPANGNIIVPAPVAVNWKQFEERVDHQCEPVHQRGLVWDTWVQKNGTITQTNPHLWAINTRPVTRKLKKIEMPPFERFWNWMIHSAHLKPKIVNDREIQMVFSHVLSA